MAERDGIQYEELAAFLEGALDPVHDERIRRELEASPALRAECEALRPLLEDLDAAGRAARASAPTVNLEEAVLAQVAEERARAAEEGPLLDQLADRLLDGDADAAAEDVVLAEVVSDLRQAGNSAAKAAHDIDLVDGVWAAIRPAGAPEAARSSAAANFEAHRRRRRLVWTGLAAAAAVLIVAGVVLLTGGQPQTPVEPRVARHDATDAPSPHAPPLEQVHPPAAVAPPGGRPPGPREEAPAPETEPLPDSEAAAPVLASVTLRDVMRARRLAANREEGWEKLIDWSRLNPAEAERLVSDADAPAAAVVAAAGALPPDDRASHLRTAIGRMGGAPPARLALAQTYYRLPGRESEAGQALRALSDEDPQNALPYYLEAKLQLDRGEVARALETLAHARTLPSASAYALDAARYSERALVAAGMDPETARVVTAMTAGTEQYEFLCDLGDDLLQYGRYFAEAGELQAAREIVESVARLGAQVNAGAAFVSEELAGFDIEREAYAILDDVYGATDATERLDALTAQTMELLAGLEGIAGFMEAVEGFLVSATNPDTWTAFADTVMDQGNAVLLQMFNEGELDLEALVHRS
jgi:hypothetical protein